jgi:DNA-binding CsgD family transcriptional regulator
MTMNGQFDPIGLLEQAYCPRLSTADWLSQMALPITEDLDHDELGVTYYFDRPEGPLQPVWVPRQGSRFEPSAVEQLPGEAFAAVNDAERARLSLGTSTPGLYTLSALLDEASGRRSRSGTSSVGVLGVLRARFGPDIRDSIAIMLPTMPLPAVFTVTCRHRVSPDPATTRVWRRLALHLGAACRLSGKGDSAEASDVECVLGPDGRIEHAVGPAERPAALIQLRQAVRDIDRARCRRLRADPTRALELWRGLCAGLSEGSSRPLPLRQRQVLFYASLGLSNKEIAYALGVAGSSVATHLHRALGSLGVTSRAEWVKISAQVSSVGAS